MAFFFCFRVQCIQYSSKVSSTPLSVISLSDQSEIGCVHSESRWIDPLTDSRPFRYFYSAPSALPYHTFFSNVQGSVTYYERLSDTPCSLDQRPYTCPLATFALQSASLASTARLRLRSCLAGRALRRPWRRGGRRAGGVGGGGTFESGRAARGSSRGGRQRGEGL